MSSPDPAMKTGFHARCMIRPVFNLAEKARLGLEAPETNRITPHLQPGTRPQLGRVRSLSIHLV